MEKTAGTLLKRERVAVIMNSSLKDQNGKMVDQMLLLVNETEKREGQIERMQMENQLRLKLLEHQVQQQLLGKQVRGTTRCVILKVWIGLDRFS